MPKLSIIIPVYNAEKHLKECLDSVINQSFKDIEIIIVNDASTDNSEDIILEYQNLDPRIITIKHEFNKSVLQTRLSGTQIATGEYLMQVDSDDYLSTAKAIQILVDTIKETNADMIQYGVHAPSDWADWFTPLSYQLITDRQKILDLFYHPLRSGNLWNRIVKTSFYRKIIPMIGQNCSINMGDDFLQTTLLMNQISSYIGIPQKLYHYRIGTGMSQKRQTTELLLDEISSLEQIFNIFHQHLPKKQIPLLENLLAHKILDRFENQLNEMVEACETSPFLDRFLKLFPPYMLFDLFSTIPESAITRILSHITIPPQNPVTNKQKVALISLKQHGGGADRVHALLLEQWQNVHLITQHSYLPFYQELTNLPIKILSDQSYYTELQDYLQQHSIHTCIVYDDHTVLPFSIMIYLKLIGIKVISYMHGDHFLPLKVPNSSVTFTTVNTLRTNLYPKIDLACLLVDYNKDYFSSLGIENTLIINNPLTLASDTVNLSLLDKHTVIWCGRLDTEKNPKAVIEAFALALPSLLPDALLLILGDGALYTQIVDLIKDLQLQDHVKLLGFVNPIEYYSQASLHIMTSYNEASPMVIGEAKSHGIPTLMYELPEIAFAQSKGIITVPQDNIQSLSQQIISLLNNPQKLHHLGQEARDSLSAFSTENTMNLWNTILDTVCTQTIFQIEGISRAPSQENINRIILIFNNYFSSSFNPEHLSSSIESTILKYIRQIKKLFDKTFPHGTKKRTFLVRRIKSILSIQKNKI